MSVEAYNKSLRITNELAKGKRSRGPGVPAEEAARDGDAVRNVLAGHDEAEYSADGSGAGECEETEEERNKAGEPDAIHRRMGHRVDAVQVFGPREATISRECKDLARTCGHLQKISRTDLV